MAEPLPEYWLRGPLPGLLPELQPIAFALLQARDEVTGCMENFPPELLWERPFGIASPGFHLQHLTGVLDRMFTYARAEELDQAQLDYLKAESVAPAAAGTGELVRRFSIKVDMVLDELKTYHTGQLADVRTVGRKKLPSTVIGLFIHAAEHTTRHTGQLLVLSVVVSGRSKS